MSIQIIRYTVKGEDEEYMWPIDTDAPTGAELVMLSLSADLARLTEENGKLLERIEGKNIDITFLKADVERLTEERAGLLLSAEKAWEQTRHALNKSVALTEENTRLADGIRHTLDLLRTGLAPEAFGMVPAVWDNYKVNKAAGELAALVKGE